ncbi:MAG: excinuclease ABC subunit UvrC [Chloroflexota bacterium]|nr:excinuclease ABC subunit UvrC [Chloroflexota bacterium]
MATFFPRNTRFTEFLSIRMNPPRGFMAELSRNPFGIAVGLTQAVTACYNSAMSRQNSDSLQAKLDSLPTETGVYLMKNDRGQVLYVGKAKNLRSRVRSYFQGSAQHTSKTVRLVCEIGDIDWILVPTEVDALILENTLIKRHMPRFNVMLKDDKTYPYVKIHWQDVFPKVSVTRKVLRDGARYYGPFTSGFAVRQTLDNLRRVFPYLTCSREITGQDQRACLYHDIKFCAAPCIGKVDRDEYRGIMQGLADFLEGKSDEAIAALEERMRSAAGALQFERAAIYRDQVELARRIVSRQQMVSTSLVDQDVVAFANDDGGTETAFQVFFVRRGKLIGRETFFLPQTSDEEPSELLASFLTQFYDDASNVPPEILLPLKPAGSDVIALWLKEKRSDTRRRKSAFRLRVPRKKDARELVKLAENNAFEALRSARAIRQADKSKQVQALQELQVALGLEVPPGRIECYDISTLQGTNTAGSMVVFAEGTPRKSDYRRFKVRGRGALGEPDDYAAMKEVLRRRFRRVVEPDVQEPGAKVRSSSAVWTILPDLVIVDGGKGQLGIAIEVLKEFDLLDQVPVVGLAKQREELFQPGKSRPILLPRDSEGLYLVQRIRDEAHRFAVTYHRNLRRKASVSSVLEKIAGVGPKRRQALLRQFSSVDRIREADVEELAAVPGMTLAAARALKEQL